MSADCQKTTCRAIPTRRVTINDAAHLPHDYSTTPGGTLFSTTPGGTRIIYDRKFLLDCRSSPVARTPPAACPTSPGSPAPCGPRPEQILNNNCSAHADKSAGEDAQFEMDI